MNYVSVYAYVALSLCGSDRSSHRGKGNWPKYMVNIIVVVPAARPDDETSLLNRSLELRHAPDNRLQPRLKGIRTLGYVGSRQGTNSSTGKSVLGAAAAVSSCPHHGSWEIIEGPIASPILSDVRTIQTPSSLRYYTLISSQCCQYSAI